MDGTGLGNILFMIGAVFVALIVYGIRQANEDRRDDDRD